MKKIILSAAVLLALLTGCTEEKKAPVQEQVTQEVKKDEVMPVKVTEEVKKDEAVEQEKATEEVKEETIKEESK
jgi:PBP1b-binding outer membrane lipoprotein LpoB